MSLFTQTKSGTFGTYGTFFLLVSITWQNQDVGMEIDKHKELTQSTAHNSKNQQQTSMPVVFLALAVSKMSVSGSVCGLRD